MDPAVDKYEQRSRFQREVEVCCGYRYLDLCLVVLPDPLPIVKCSVALESRDASLVFGKFSEREGCSLQSVSLDGR